MPAQNTHADSLGRYLTGASSDGGTQASQAASLGNFASSSEVASLVANVTSPISGITINYVSGANGVGSGTLTAASTSTLTWTAPGGTAGAAVSISNGQTVILEDGTTPGAYVRVTSSTAGSLTGTATVALATAADNVISMSDVSPAEDATGSVKYRAIMLKNRASIAVNNIFAWIGKLGTSLVSGTTQLGASGAGTIVIASGVFSTWPIEGFCRIENSSNALKEIVYYLSRTSNTLTIPANGRGLLGTTATAGAATDNIHAVPGIRIAYEVPATNPGAIQTIANENAAPTGLTWSTAITQATGLSIGNLAAGTETGIWIERIVVAGATGDTAVQNAIQYQFDAA